MTIEQLKQAASNGDTDAMVTLGKMLMTGKRVTQDPITGEKWLKQAARKKHPEALFTMAELLLDEGQTRLAITYLKRADKQKLSAAIKLLGHVYRGDYNPEIRDLKLARRYFLKYYDIDQIDALEPLLSLYDETLFKNPKTARAFLQAASDYGLLKAQYYLAEMVLEHDKDYLTAIELLENYYAATADAQAAKRLHTLYDPHDKTYPKCPEKNAVKAQAYLREAIAANRQIEGANFLHERPTYLPKNTVGIESYLNRLERRLKTSHAIDQTFAETLTRATFETELHLTIETISRIDATWTYRTKTVEKIESEKTVKRKKKVKKGRKTTGKVRVSEIIPITKKKTTMHEHEHKETLDKSYRALSLTHLEVASLHHLLTELESHQGRFHFESVPTERAIKATLRKQLLGRFKAPKKAKQVRLNFNFDYVYILKPHLKIQYVHGDNMYQETVDLSDEQLSYTVPFPLEAHCAKQLKKFKQKQSTRIRNQRFFSVLSGGLSAVLLYRLGQRLTIDLGFFLDGLAVIMGGFIAYLLYRLTRFKSLTDSKFIDHYDTDDFTLLQSALRKQTLKMGFVVIIALALSIALVLI